VTPPVVRPDDPLLADEAARWASAYVHVPFCARRCPYCDFAVVVDGEPGADAGTDAYVEAVVAEIAMERPWGPLHAIAFGGGTPSRLSAVALGRIVGALRRRFGVVDGVEVAIEVNPEDWTDRFAAELLDAGFDRVSFGVQSFDAHTLAWLGRVHDPHQAEAAVVSARHAGFRSVGIDLIYGTPGEDLDRWVTTVRRALALDLDHLSAYALTVERGTALSRSILAGAPAPDPDQQADAYEAIGELAVAAGLVRYEVSNWARPGHHSRYNLATWGGAEFVAFGAGAHDHRDGVRARNVRRLDVYLDRVASGVRPRAGSERLDRAAADVERLVLGLRRVAGVRRDDLVERLVVDPAGRRLVAAGVLRVGPDRLVVERPLVTDEVSRAVLALVDRDPSVSGDDC